MKNRFQLILVIIFAASSSLVAQKGMQGQKIPGRTYTKRPPAAVAELPWEGSYYGITRCANCDGIDMSLTLKKGNKYIFSTKAANTDEPAYIQKGRFVWDGDIVFLKKALLEMPYMFKVEEFQVKAIFDIYGELKGADWEGYTLIMPHIIRLE
ncbi:MAG: copper resistance protein NlpE N-terminal domain-containing protein [Crocinitomicaceae bacterium]|nr:copper resistance protein NlpE N-terminal domain-containing protein [Crocinitomicaceae bacterium]